MNTYRIIYILMVISLLAACGTFEIGIENTTVIDNQVEATENPTAETNEKTPSAVPAATQTPIPSDEQLIAAVLAEKLAQPIDQLDINVTNNTGEYASGNFSNGYFLAARQGGVWVIVYDGQATPPCDALERYQFPVDMAPECLDTGNNLVNRYASEIDTIGDSHSLDCGPGSPGASPGSPEYVACNIKDGLLSRNTSALLGFMADPFIIGYWLSEGVIYQPADFLPVLHHLYNYHDTDYTPRLTFTTDRSYFPELDGRPLDERFEPEVKIVEVVYSQGWGPDGDQEALIFISQDDSGELKWHSMLYGVFITIP